VLEDIRGVAKNTFCDGSDTYLTEEQYAMVKHVDVNFISSLLCLYYSNIQLNMCMYLLLG
jgi:hypothetical protein